MASLCMHHMKYKYCQLFKKSRAKEQTHHNKSLSTRSKTVARIYIVPDTLCPYDVPDM
jgi:hypothetical protein